jgi:hypothetical protein
MKRIIFLILFGFSTFAIANEQKFICGITQGLLISKDKASFHINDYSLCQKMGVMQIFHDDCKEPTKSLHFDSVSYSLSVIVKGEQSIRFQCVKRN